MHRGQRLSVVIPCYNEEAGIRLVMERMPRCVDEVVVVDNDSTDRTAEVARCRGARVVTQRLRGYGAAYQAGFASVTGDLVVTLGAGNVWQAGETLLERLRRETHE